MGLRVSAVDLDLASQTGLHERSCLICGGSLKGHRKDARCCSASCRAELSRVKAIVNGTNTGPYRSLAERLSKRKSSRPLTFPLGMSVKGSEAHTTPLTGRSTAEPDRVLR